MSKSSIKLLNRVFCVSVGPKVVSKDISVESIEEVSKILKRAPVIWDNIHANDYDQKRLFLGPYKGRSTELIPRLKGVLTNPNCEFESNFVAIHTLATWYKSNMNGVRKDVVMSKYDPNQSCVDLCIIYLCVRLHSCWSSICEVIYQWAFLYLFNYLASFQLMARKAPCPSKSSWRMKAVTKSWRQTCSTAHS